jgi:alpha-tubulin suppressor-like RCC1 family protein
LYTCVIIIISSSESCKSKEKMAVYSFGMGKLGQLGHGVLEDCLEPVIVEGLKGKKIINVKCGEMHSIAVGEYGDVFSWGRGREGQLGHGTRDNLSLPQRVEALRHEKVVSAACGNYHSMALTDTGKKLYMYIWRSNTPSQANSIHGASCITLQIHNPCRGLEWR